MKIPPFYLILTLIIVIAACALIGYGYWQYTRFDMDMTIREGGRLVLVMLGCFLASPFVLFFGLKLAMVFKPSYDKSISKIQADQLSEQRRALDEQKRANDIQQQILNNQRKGNRGKPLPKADVKTIPKKP